MQTRFLTKNQNRIMAIVMSILMIITILPAEYLLSYAAGDDDKVSFVSNGDAELEYNDDNSTVTIQAKTYNKEYEIKTQFDYKIPYSDSKTSFAIGEVQFYIPSLGFYNNGVTANYIMPTDISVNTNGSDIWQYEETEVSGQKVIKVSNKVELTENVIANGSMQFATVINPRTMLLGDVTLNPITVITSYAGTNATTNSLTWNYKLYGDSFDLIENVADVQVESDTTLGNDAADYYWAKYNISISKKDLQSLPANNFRLINKIPENAILYSVNGDTSVTTTDNAYTVDFSVADWNYTQSDTPKEYSVIVKYPKANFNAANLTQTNSSQLLAQFIGETEYDEVATASVEHELHDYDVKYDGDLFAITTSSNSGYEISWNSLNRGEASPFSFYIGGLSRYNNNYSALFTDDHLEILQKDGTFRRLNDDEYAFNKVIINDLSHFKNAANESYSSLDYAIIIDNNIHSTGSVTNNSQTITLPANTTNVTVAFYDLNSSIYLDNTAIQVIGSIKTDATNVMQEGELRNLVNLIVADDSNNVLNVVDATNYTGTDATRLATADMTEYGMYLQRDIASQVVTYKSSQINVTTAFNPSKSVYNETTKLQDSSVEMTTYFGFPGEVNEFSLYTVLPEGVTYVPNTLSFKTDADLKLKDGSTIAASDVTTFLTQYATINATDDYKGSGRTLVSIKFDIADDKAICYDSTLSNSNTSGKITSIFDVTVPNESKTYNNVVGFMFDDTHNETILATKDNGAASQVSNQGAIWTDIDNDGNVDEKIDYATAPLTAVYVEATNNPVVKTPSVNITKVAEKEIYNPDEVVTYTIKVTNDGETPLTNVVVTDSLTNGTFVEQQGVTVNKNVATIATMAVDEEITLTYKYTVPTDAKDGDIITNIVEVETDENVSDEAEETVEVDVPNVLTPSVNITKVAEKEIYNPDEVVTYTIKVKNDGETPLTNVVVTDSLTNGAFVEQQGVTVNKNVATIATMAVDEEITLTYKYTVPTDAKDGDIITNIVEVETDENVNDEAEETVEVDIPVVLTPSVSITKTADKENYSTDETITYTIKVKNDGETPLTNVVVTDSLTDGAFVSQQGVTVNKNVATIATMAVDEEITLTFKYIVSSDVVTHDGSTIDVKNIVKVTTNENVSDEADVTVKVKTPDAPVDAPSLEIIKTANKEVYNPGETITYTIKVVNNGDVDLTNVSVVETLKGKFVNTSDNVTVLTDTDLVIKSLKVSETETLTFEYKVPTDAVDDSSIKNIVKASETTHNLNVSDDVTVKVDVPPVASIDVVKTADKESYKTGETITYTIKVVNNGTKDLTNINVEDLLLGGKFAANDNITVAKDNVVIIKSLKAGESIKLTYTYVVPKDFTADKLENTVVVTETTNSLKDEAKVSVKIIKNVVESVKDVIQTGDTTPVILFCVLAVISFFGMAIITISSSKKRK